MHIKDIKTEKMRRLVAGHYMPTEHAASMLAEIDDHDASEEFKNGALCVLGFLTCEKGEDMHGATFAEFLSNFFEIVSEDDVPEAIMSAAKKVIEDLRDMGVEVVDASVIKVVR